MRKSPPFWLGRGLQQPFPGQALQRPLHGAAPLGQALPSLPATAVESGPRPEEAVTRPGPAGAAERSRRLPDRLPATGRREVTFGSFGPIDLSEVDPDFRFPEPAPRNVGVEVGRVLRRYRLQ
jgi:hypothetical protein